MKNKIAYKLIGYFASTFVLFSIVIGAAFFYLFTIHTTEIHKKDLELRANKISQTLETFWSVTTDKMNTTGQMRNGVGGGYGAYLKFIDDIAMSDVWIVDKQSKLITRGQDEDFIYSELPDDAESVIEKALNGSTSFSEEFSGLLATQSITVGVPIKTNGITVGVVLLHSPINGISEAVNSGFKALLISMVVALFISGAIAIWLSFSFTKPLSQMRRTAVQLSSGDYTAKTGITQTNELGQLAQSLDILSVRLQEASKESENLEQMRRDFVTNISHELRTPVTVMRGSLEALLDGVINEPTQITEYHQQMLSESVHLQRLVNDLLDLSRLQNTSFSMDSETLNLVDIATDVARNMEPIARKKQVSIQLKNEMRTCFTHGDYNRVRQLVMILLDNAIKFSPKGKKVTIQFTSNNTACNLSVSDEGSGIPSEQIPFIFDRFHKIQSEENKKGTGLGLAIAKQIAQRHGMEIMVSSQPDVKTTFTIHIPRMD